METYTVDYSIPQEDEMEQVFTINYNLSFDALFPRCRLMRTMTPPSSSPVSGAGITTARPTAPTAATRTCRTTSPSATTATRRRRGRRTPWPSEHAVKQWQCVYYVSTVKIFMYIVVS